MPNQQQDETNTFQFFKSKIQLPNLKDEIKIWPNFIDQYRHMQPPPPSLSPKTFAVSYGLSIEASQSATCIHSAFLFYSIVSYGIFFFLIVTIMGEGGLNPSSPATPNKGEHDMPMSYKAPNHSLYFTLIHIYTHVCIYKLHVMSVYHYFTFLVTCSKYHNDLCFN